jgi:putative PIN family toxin of toxin-antitoxin system
MRVYFDASVIIAALLSATGGSSKLIRLIKKDLLRGITSQTVIEEILEEDKSSKLGRQKRELEQFIQDSGILVRRSITEEEIEPYKNLIDIEDAHLIAGAKLTKSYYLVTLDKKHLLNKKVKNKFLPLKIVSPKELLEEVTREN